MSCDFEGYWPIVRTGNPDNERQQINNLFERLIKCVSELEVGGGSGDSAPGEGGVDGTGANLSTSRDATTVTIESDSGDNASIPSADATTAGILTAADWQKIQDAGGVAPIGAAWHDTSALGSTEDVRVYLPESITITEVDIQTKGGTGSCVLDILQDDLEGNVTSIVASAAPEISSGTSYNDATLTGWTTSISGNRELIFRIDSTSTFTFIEVLLTI